ncbi:GGDEF domain-containing protein [Thioalkalivibrio sp. XN279]|uniref:diguanylate cyclase domain-containing protein n=1 Tax=Thioalkalivibrio sp. XN279 TaxID=2714953 RepID=UPI00140CF55A|nr:diguanylate cyclase [Thioalkalivibrio sp. XN279]
MKVTAKPRWLPQLGLQARLLVAFLVVAVLPLLAFFLVQQQQLEHHLRTRAESHVEQLALAQQRRLAHEFRRLSDQLDLIASRTQMRISLAEYLDSGDLAALALVERILGDAAAPAENILSIGIRAPDGRRIALDESRTPSAAPGKAGMGKADWIPAATPGASRSGMHLLAPDGVQVVARLEAELLLGPRRLGSLFVLSDTRDLGAILQDYQDADAGGQTLLVLEKPGAGRMILAPAHGESTGLRVSEVRLDAAVEAKLWRGAVSPQAEIVAWNNGELFAMRELPVPGIKVVIAVAREEFRRFGAGQARALVLNLVVLLLLALVVAMFMAARIAKPLRHLSEATRKLRGGDSSVRVPEGGWGELGQLARTFNVTAAELARQAQDLEEEMSRSRNAQRELADMAGTDHLTGLMNRRRLMEILIGHFDPSNPRREQGALLYLDLDRFKPVNDLFGHDAGDETLRVVAHRLTGLVRANDPLARLGGDEFAIFIREPLPVDEVHELAERITQALSRPISVCGRTIEIGCSVGVAMIKPGDSHEELLYRADHDMYRVKAMRSAAKEESR